MGKKRFIVPLQFGLIGKTLKHSFSKCYFESQFKSFFDADADYSNIEIADELILKQFCETRALKLNGFNVTIPYKEKIISFLHQLDDISKAINAVNTVKVKQGRLIGYNTDWIGFVNSLKPHLKSDSQYKALILGTGGASRAVAFGLATLGISYEFVSSSNHKHLSYKSLDYAIVKSHRIIINTTPLGMYPNVNQYPDIPYQVIGLEHIIMDLIYNPRQTVFLKKSLDQGAITLNGQQMLELQAQKSWEIWLDK